MTKRSLILIAAIAATASASFAQLPAPSETTRYSQEQLDDLLAPVALYPDPLLTQILIASTYPLEIVEAQRWVDQNAALTGDGFASALEDQPWDASVKSLVNFPQVLQMMNERLDWTTDLGNAFLQDQAAVMNTVQSLRARAQQAGNLQTTAQQTVTFAPDNAGGSTIVIEPAQPDVIYVPAYDPAAIYGTWWYPTPPPYVWYPARYRPSRGLFFGDGFRVGLAWGYAWGGFDWRDHYVDVDVHRNERWNARIDRDRYVVRDGHAIVDHDGRGPWQHDAVHRRDVPYHDPVVAERFHGVSERQAIDARNAYRGREDDQRAAPRAVTRPERAAPPPAREPAIDGGDAVRDSDRGNSAARDAERGRASRAGPSRSSAPAGGGRGGR